MDKRIKYIAVFDTETAGSLGSPLVYDLGVTITDKRGKIYEQGSWIIKEVFDNGKMMQDAYYGKKRPMYELKIKNHLLREVPFKVAKKEFNKLMEKWNVKALMAYNVSFDVRALASTMRYLKSQFTEKEGKNFLEKEIEIQDIWSFACETIYQQKTFFTMIDRLKAYTSAKNPLTNAEVGYRYISGVDDFEEKHTALNDSEIEVKIMVKCYKSHKKFTKGIINQPWRLVAKRYKELQIA